MVIPFLRASRFFRALVLTVALFSFLLWLYIVLRIVFTDANMFAPFIYFIPSIRIWVLGAVAFIVSAASTFVYLWLWFRFDRFSVFAPGYQQRGP